MDSHVIHTCTLGFKTLTLWLPVELLILDTTVYSFRGYLYTVLVTNITELWLILAGGSLAYDSGSLNLLKQR